MRSELLDTRYKFWSNAFRMVVLMVHAISRNDNLRVLSILTSEVVKVGPVLRNTCLKPKKKNLDKAEKEALEDSAHDSPKSKLARVIPLALCKARCGDLRGAYELIVSKSNREDLLEIGSKFMLVWIETPFVELLCELWLLLLDAKIHDGVQGEDLPPRAELEQYALKTLSDLHGHADVFVIFKPIYLMHKAQLETVYGQFKQAKADLNMASELLTEMEMAAYKRRCDRQLAELERHIDLQENLSNILALEV